MKNKEKRNNIFDNAAHIRQKKTVFVKIKTNLVVRT
jgi:hypothetical protein